MFLYAATHTVTHLQANILLPLRQRDRDRGILIRGGSMVLDHRPHRVLEQLEEHMIEMRGHVHDPYVPVAFQLCNSANARLAAYRRDARPLPLCRAVLMIRSGDAR